MLSFLLVTHTTANPPPHSTGLFSNNHPPHMLLEQITFELAAYV